MPSDNRPPPFLVADHRALDFLNSIYAPRSGDTIDWIEDGQGLVDWLIAADLVPSERAAALTSGHCPGQLDEVAAEARALRAWFRSFVAAHAGRPLGLASAAELKVVNTLLARDSLHRQIEPGNPGDADARRRPSVFRCHLRRRWTTTDDLLLPLAEAMGDLVCTADFRLVKNCEATECPLWFLDTTKNHTRRWCSMSVCGNRAKVAAHRARKRLAT